MRFSLTGAAMCGAPLFSEGGEITLPLKSEGLQSSILRLGQALSAFGKVGIGCASESEASAAADILSGGVRFGGGSAYIFGGSFPGCAAFGLFLRS